MAGEPGPAKGEGSSRQEQRRSSFAEVYLRLAQLQHEREKQRWQDEIARDPDKRAQQQARERFQERLQAFQSEIGGIADGPQKELVPEFIMALYCEVKAEVELEQMQSQRRALQRLMGVPDNQPAPDQQSQALQQGQQEQQLRAQREQEMQQKMQQLWAQREQAQQELQQLLAQQAQQERQAQQQAQDASQPAGSGLGWL
ncbi:hypothetical protein COHA_010738 [Chlorella ohadii]|uniref:Uncharacterized protein n=1 Tax=Chlorella ohadii TaxID=2649997 RepID=A0AAD5GWQ3_9CHLO|nr:hypothetical protein COHA_010738 [Chlorella ohadii]